MAAAGWGAGQLTPEELLNLAGRLHRGRDASVRQAGRSPDSGQMRRYFAVAAEMAALWGEVADELIVRHEAQARDVTTAREPEAGS